MSAAPATTSSQPYDGPMFDDHDKEYLKIAFGLAVLTAIEVWLSYAGLEGAALALPLLALAAVKFIIVAAFFMHLKPDTPLFRRLFTGGAVLAGFCYLGVLSAMHAMSGALHWIIYGVFSVALLVFVFRRTAGDAHADHDHDHAGHDHSGHAH